MPNSPPKKSETRINSDIKTPTAIAIAERQTPFFDGGDDLLLFFNPMIPVISAPTPQVGEAHSSSENTIRKAAETAVGICPF